MKIILVSILGLLFSLLCSISAWSVSNVKGFKSFTVGALLGVSILNVAVVPPALADVSLQQQLRELQRAEAKRIDNEHYFDTDMDDLLSMEAYIRPSLRELARSQFKMQGLMASLVGKHCIEQNKISVRTITRIDVLWLKIRNILVTGCTRPESYTHIWPLIYASFVVVFYAKPLNW